MVKTTYRCRRPIDIGLSKRMPGELVPEAETWYLVDHQIHVGNLVEAIVEWDEYTEAVQKFCPELAERLGVKLTKPKVVALKENK